MAPTQKVCVLRDIDFDGSRVLLKTAHLGEVIALLREEKGPAKGGSPPFTSTSTSMN